nr:immunoglobulin light chain junction region [Macaca mulatta]
DYYCQSYESSLSPVLF